MMESINIGETMNKFDGSINESGFLKLSKFDSKTSQNNAWCLFTWSYIYYFIFIHVKNYLISYNKHS